MTAARDPVDPVPIRNGDARSAEELERDLERIRSEMDHTLNLIEDQLSPHRLIDRALEHLHGGPGLFAANLGRTVRRHPVPTAMFAAGLAWLLLAERGTSASRTLARLQSDALSLARGVVVAGDSFPSRIHFKGEENMSGNRDEVRGNRRGLQDRVSSTLDDARERFGEVGSIAQHQVDRVRTGFEHMLEEQPLVLGAVALALGAVLGATLPTTRIENRYLGPTRDDLQDRSASMRAINGSAAKSVVSTAGSAAVEQAEKKASCPVRWPSRPRERRGAWRMQPPTRPRPKRIVRDLANSGRWSELKKLSSAEPDWPRRRVGSPRLRAR